MDHKFHKLGYFLIEMSRDNPMDYNFIIKVKHRLDISDANIFVLIKI